LKNKTIDEYRGVLSRLDNNSKKKLIIRLAESIEIEEESKFDLDRLFGAWEDSRDSDEIIKEIRESRVNSRDIIEFEWNEQLVPISYVDENQFYKKTKKWKT